MLTDPAHEAEADAMSTDSSSASEADIGDEALARLEALEAAVQENGASYEAHLQLVSALSELKLAARLEAARQAFAAHFPLPEDQWTAWLQDAMANMRDEADAERLLQLARRSLDDYLSVELWQQYLIIAREADPDVAQGGAAGAAAFRRLAGEAVAACGLHVKLGSAVHAEACKFEGERLAEAVEQHGADSAEAREAAGHAAVAWGARLGAVLVDGAESMAEFTAWRDALPRALHEACTPPKLDKAFASAQAALALRTAFEDSIDDSKPADEALLAAMWAYIRFERSQGAAGWPRVRLILERAAARFPVTVQLWQELIAHVEGGADASAASVATLCWRASRNCPWSGEVWAARLRAVERQAAAEAAGSEAAETLLQEHARIYEEALQVGLQDVDDYEAVIKCRLTALRRRSGAGAPALAADAVAAMKLLVAYFPEATTLHLSLCKHWATCAAVDPAGACACWEERLSQCSMAQLWPAYREYIEWRTNSGAIEDARRLFEELLNRERKRALPAAAALECAEAHLAFERAHGTAEQELDALNLARRARSRAAAAPVAAAASVPQDGAPSKKRPAESGPDDSAKPKAKKGKKAQAGAQQKESKAQAGGQGGKGGKTYNDENTVFVKHLSPDVTEEHLREKFAAAKEIRLLVKPGGASKGCAFVQFGSSDDAAAAIAQHDQELWHGKHILVAQSVPPGKRQKGQQATAAAPHKGPGHKGKPAPRKEGDKSAPDDAEEVAEHPHKRLGAAAMMPRAVAKKGGSGAVTQPAASNAAFKDMLGL